MTMRDDDYLWDGSGEPDSDVEKLEGLLGRYRSERPAPELPVAPVVPFRPRRTAWTAVYAAAAAAVVLSLSLGLWWSQRRAVPPGSIAGVNSNESVPPPSGITETPGVVQLPVPGPTPEPKILTHGPRTPFVRTNFMPKRHDEAVTVPAPVDEPKLKPLVDVATAEHIEQAEMLLRSFRNASAEDDDDALAEVAFDSRQSRELLDRNALLRRTAGAKKNLPVNQLLGDLEPFLMDIANLGDKPSRDDVREIQGRLEQREMVSSLEAYSINRPAQGF
jgi:hypothetical protein